MQFENFHNITSTCYQELYKKVVPFFIYSIFKNLKRFHTKTSETVFKGQALEILGLFSEVFRMATEDQKIIRRLRFNFGNFRKTLGQLQKSSEGFGSTSRNFGSLRISTSEILRRLRINFGNLRKTSGELRLTSKL